MEFLERKSVNVLERLRKFFREHIAWHVNSALSSLNIIVALYGFWIPKGLEKGIERIVVISKGHCSLALYAWYVEMNILNEGELYNFACLNSKLQAHLEAGRVPGIVVSTGSLGQGLSVANGIALASKIDGVRREVAVLLGDGELDEGQVWEAAATAATLKLDNVVALVDRNMTQHSGYTERVKAKEPLKEKWIAFGWNVMEARNNIRDIIERLEEAEVKRDKPTALLVHSDSLMY